MELSKFYLSLSSSNHLIIFKLKAFSESWLVHTPVWYPTI